MLLQDLRADYRIGPFSVVDTVGALLIVYLIAPFLSAVVRRLGFEVPRSSWLWLTIPVALVAHLMFRPDTALTTMIVDPNGSYLAKAVLLVMIFMAFRGMKPVK